LKFADSGITGEGCRGLNFFWAYGYVRFLGFGVYKALRENLGEEIPRASRATGLVELELGHIQYGEQPFAFAEALNFRALCTECLWVSLYFT